MNMLRLSLKSTSAFAQRHRLSALLRIAGLLCAFALLLPLLPLAAGGAFDRDWGPQETRTFTLGVFDSVKVQTGISVEILQAKTSGLRVTAGEKIFDRLDIRLEGKTLVIGFKPMISFSSGPVRAEIAMPQLIALDVSSGSRAGLRFDARSSDRLHIQASSGSKVEGILAANDLVLDLSSGSSMSIEGFSQSLVAEISSGSSFDSPDFACDTAEIDASSGSSARLGVQTRLSVDASGGSSVRYRGSPQVSKDLSGGSAVSQD